MMESMLPSLHSGKGGIREEREEYNCRIYIVQVAHAKWGNRSSISWGCSVLTAQINLLCG